MNTSHLLALSALAALTACAAQPTPQQRAALPPPYYVPSATLVDLPGTRPPNPYTLLASADEQELFFPRAEKFVYGSFPLFEVSSSTTYTYDAQNISAPWGFGYRYSYITRSSLATP